MRTPTARLTPVLALALAGAFASCTSREEPQRPPSPPAAVGDSARPATAAEAADSDSAGANTSVDPSLAAPGSVAPIVARRPRPTRLSPLADSIVASLVFAPTNQTWFLAAARGKRLLIDIGRVDREVRRPPPTLAAYKLAVEAKAPIPIGARFRLRGAWGADDAEVNGFDTWNGRIVATVATAPRVDSLAKAVEPLPVTAQLADSAVVAADDTCHYRTPDSTLVPRLEVIRDSILGEMKLKEAPPYARLAKTVQQKATQVAGCFGPARVVMFATMWAGDYEWVRERVVLVDSLGAAKPLRVVDYRFKAHEGIYALDGDGDGIDDVAARGNTEHAGGTVVLRLVDGKRLERWAAGFVWENR